MIGICDCGSGRPANRGHGSACDVCVDAPDLDTLSEASRGSGAPAMTHPDDTPTMTALLLSARPMPDGTWHADAEGLGCAVTRAAPTRRLAVVEALRAVALRLESAEREWGAEAPR